MSASTASDAKPLSSTYVALERALTQHVGLLWGALTNVVTTSVAYAVAPYAQLTHLMIIHLLGAVLISTRYGMVISTLTAITGALAFDYFCIPPIFAFALPDPHSVATFAGILLVALLVCWLNQGVRLQREAANASEARTRALCELSIELSQVADTTELIARAERHLVKLFGGEARVTLGRRPELPPPWELHPIAADAELLGYIASTSGSAGPGRAAERRLLMKACAEHVADAVRRLALAEAARMARVDADVERNRNALLSAVSHDMKTPLASILTAGTSLLSAAKHERGAYLARELLETIVQEAERMNDLITNLLSVTRLESGAAALNKTPEALDDLIFGALSRFSGRLEGRAVSVDVPRDLPLVRLDPVLFDQVLVNLLENALRYTPPRSPIDVRVSQAPGWVSLDVCDRGPGIPVAEREKVFDRFYRGMAAKRNDGGTGLGLTICRAVARAHEGDITVLSRAGGGATVRFSLPCSAMTSPLTLNESMRAQA